MLNSAPPLAKILSPPSLVRLFGIVALHDGNNSHPHKYQIAQGYHTYTRAARFPIHTPSKPLLHRSSATTDQADEFRYIQPTHANNPQK